MGYVFQMSCMISWDTKKTTEKCFKLLITHRAIPRPILIKRNQLSFLLVTTECIYKNLMIFGKATNGVMPILS